MRMSSVDTAVPYGVVTLICPDNVFDGTAVDRLVDVALDGVAYVAFIRVRSFASTVSKLVPVTVSGVPATPRVGEKLVIVGARLALTTVNAVALVAEPPGDVTAIVPVVAPDGTV